MTDRFFILIGGLSSKAFAMLFAGSSALLGIVIGEAATNDLARAGVAGAIGTCIAAIFLVVPRIMEQRRKSRESEAGLRADAIHLLVTAHDRDIAFYTDKVAALELIVTLERNAKHDAVNEWGSMKDGYLILAGQLKSLGEKPEITIQTKTYREIIGDSDSEIKAIKAARVEITPATSR